MYPTIAAAHVERQWGEEEVAEVLASHYLDAQEAVPDAPDDHYDDGRRHRTPVKWRPKLPTPCKVRGTAQYLALINLQCHANITK